MSSTELQEVRNPGISGFLSILNHTVQELNKNTGPRTDKNTSNYVILNLPCHPKNWPSCSVKCTWKTSLLNHSINYQVAEKPQTTQKCNIQYGMIIAYHYALTLDPTATLESTLVCWSHLSKKSNLLIKQIIGSF